EQHERFLREARAAARLVHPNVVQIFQVGETPDFRFIAMEYVEGTSMSRAAKRQGGRLPEQFVMERMREAADALALAETYGIIHRDIKPSNLLLTPAGVLKIADFGLAFQAGGGTIGPGVPNQLEGTPFYMSPEQWSSTPVTPAADVYSLGCTFYHLLVGSIPYPAGDIFASMQAHYAEPVPDPRAKLPAMDPGLAELIRRCMSKQPHERPAARLLVQKLDEMLLLRRSVVRRREQALLGGEAARPAPGEAGPPPAVDSAWPPPGDSAQPPPGGSPRPPPGEAMWPAGEARRPAGEAMRPAGEVARASGEVARASGEALPLPGDSGWPGAGGSVRPPPAPSSWPAAADSGRAPGGSLPPPPGSLPPPPGLGSWGPAPPAAPGASWRPPPDFDPPTGTGLMASVVAASRSPLERSYREFYGFRDHPFSDIRREEYYWHEGPFAAALQAVASAVTSGRVCVVQGAGGSGRTFTCEMLECKFPGVQVHVVEPQLLFGAGIVVALCRQAGVLADQGASQRFLLEAFLAQAVPPTRPDVIVTVVVDGLDPSDAETLRELSALRRAAQRGRMGLVLTGAEGLAAELAGRPEALGFAFGAEAVTLRPMTQGEMVEYIDYRLSTVGGAGQFELDAASRQLLFARSGGSPKLVNVYFHNALTLAAVLGDSRIHFKTIRLAMKSDSYLTPRTALALLEGEAKARG
ncbi:MAG TPA: protein kinase, partial [Polyangiaceae bacterium]|nr:protein kinase [Polyangiaceae bacterium]